MRRAKIVCTLGPASASQETLEKLIHAGMDVARLNLSHANHDEHQLLIGHLRAAQGKVRKAVGILADLQGPKIRTGKLKQEAIQLIEGKEIAITTDESVLGTEECISTTYPHLAGDVNVGDRILLDDGFLELRVIATDKKQIFHNKIIHGGTLKHNKGINLPGVALRLEALTAKDKEDLAFVLKAGVDLVAMSFVRSPTDIEMCRRAMHELGYAVPIIAKLEKPEAIARLDAILDQADGVMVARGDLGVEIPPEKVPAIQKDIIRRSNMRGVPAIVATQMLNSMIEHPRPTRAEASDVANAIFDNTDAVMLSGESASGRYPIAAVAMMSRIVEAAESAVHAGDGNLVPLSSAYPDVTCMAACSAARKADAALIVAFTLTGTTARLLSRCRPSMPIIAFSPNQKVRRRLSLLWGVTPRVLEPLQETEEMVRRVDEELLELGLAKHGERIVIVFGAPVGQAGKINSMRLHTISA